MTVAQTISLALTISHTKSGQFASTDLISFYNMIRNDLANTIIKDVNENFFFEIWAIDAEDETEPTRANGEYLYPIATSLLAGMKKLLRLAIKGNYNDSYFTNCREVDVRKLPHDWLWYMENQPKADPIYFIADESFFIAPKFSAADLPATQPGNKQIKAYGVAKLVDLTSSDIESAVLIPSEFHSLIALGMKALILSSRQKTVEGKAASDYYEIKKAEMVDVLTNRDDSSMLATLPSDYNLGYGQ